MKKIIFIFLVVSVFIFVYSKSVSASSIIYDPNFNYIQLGYDYISEQGDDISSFDTQVAFVDSSSITTVTVVLYNSQTGYWGSYPAFPDNIRLKTNAYAYISFKLDPDNSYKPVVLENTYGYKVQSNITDVTSFDKTSGKFIQSSININLWNLDPSGSNDRPTSTILFEKNYFGVNVDGNYTSVTIPQDKSLLLIPKGTESFVSTIYFDTNLTYGWYRRLDNNNLLLIDGTGFAVTDVATSKSSSEMCKPFGWDNMVIDNCFNLPAFLSNTVNVSDDYLKNGYVYGIYNRADEDLIIKYNPSHFESLLFIDEETMQDSKGNIYNNPNSDFGNYNDNNFRPENNTDVDLVKPEDQFGSLADLIGKIPELLGVFGSAIAVIGLMIEMFFVAMPSFVVMGYTSAFLMILIILIIKALH